MGPYTCARIPGFSGGTLKCTDYRFDTSSCIPSCGNGTIDFDKSCDGNVRSPDYAGKSCKDIWNPMRTWPRDKRVKFKSGQLGCSSGCTIDLSACKPAPVCYDTGWGPTFTVHCF